MRIDWRRGELKNMSGFFFEALQRKKERKDSKNKVTKTCRKEKIEKKHPPTRKLTKKSEIFWDKTDREERFPFFYRKLQTVKKTQKEKWTKKEKKIRLKSSTPKKKEKTQGWKKYGKQWIRRKRKGEEEISSEEEFFISQKHFSKKKKQKPKRDKSRYKKKIFQNIE